MTENCGRKSMHAFGVNWTSDGMLLTSCTIHVHVELYPIDLRYLLSANAYPCMKDCEIVAVVELLIRYCL